MSKTTTLIATILVVLVAVSTQGFCQEDGIDACYKKMNGQLRISDKCRPPESHISLVSREEFEALVERVEALEEGEVIDPCEGMGDDCCTSDEDCTEDTLYCVDPIKCMGVRSIGVCENNTCKSKSLDDDSGCNGEIALDCGDDGIVYCTDELDQDPPSCPTN